MHHSPRPIFVIGSPRSGTSILSWCIGQHPNVLTLPESNWLGEFAKSLEKAFDLGIAWADDSRLTSQLGAMGIAREEFYKHFGGAIHDLILRYKQPYLERAAPLLCRDYGETLKLVRSSLDPKTRWIDSTPEYSFYIFALFKLFPSAQFIHILRDASSVTRSLLRFRTPDGSPIVNSEDEAYLYWLRAVRACLEAEHVLSPDVILRVRYSDLVESPETLLRQCLKFLGEEFSSDCLIPLSVRINSSSSFPESDSPRSLEDSPVKRAAEALNSTLIHIEGVSTPQTGTARVIGRGQDAPAPVSDHGGSDDRGREPRVSTRQHTARGRCTLAVESAEFWTGESSAATVTWNTGDGTPGQVWVAVDGDDEVLFAEGPSGSVRASWFVPGRSYVWKLYAGTDRRALLASTTVPPIVPYLHL